jgi:hypothetical protein
MLRSERSSLSQRNDVLLSVLTPCFARVLRRRQSAPRQREHHQERCREKHGDLLQRVTPSTFRFLLPITRFAPIHRSHLGHAWAFTQTSTDGYGGQRVSVQPDSLHPEVARPAPRLPGGQAARTQLRLFHGACPRCGVRGEAVMTLSSSMRPCYQSGHQ